MPVHVEFVGASGAGKTTLVERLVPVLAARGLRVGTVKHASHGFDMDRPGSDSARHREAGASPVLIVGPGRAALQWDFGDDTLADLLERYFAGCDVVLVEGFGAAPGPKVFVHRRGFEPKTPPDREAVILTVTDEPLGFAAEVGPDAVDAVADAVEDVVRAAGGA
ncbi:MAG: molybdopterin-guanine dinucleotide biosynthesis protein B [Actinobacteria bacterium ATB1]|nr:molybdopterin-guanine dinucleotide biosynthesis protein B [Actinobacteria bacterium ATB1]